MKWKVKYGIQRVLSLLPWGAGRYLNHSLAVRFGNLRNFKFYEISHTLAMVQHLRSLGFEARGKTFVELGTGWSSASPMILIGMGAGQVYSFDLYRHLEQKYIDAAQAALRDVAKYLDPNYPFVVDLKAEAAQIDFSRIELNKFHYSAPHDATRTKLPDNSVDCYYSVAVLEHIPKLVVANLLRESLRILKPGGYCFHYVQPTMHAAYFDKRATGIDYLTCSDMEWHLLYDNDIAHESRLRGVEYVQLLKDSGFDLIGEWHTVDEKAMSALPRKRLAQRFQNYTPEEICTDYIWIIGRKALISA